MTPETSKKAYGGRRKIRRGRVVGWVAVCLVAYACFSLFLFESVPTDLIRKARPTPAPSRKPQAKVAMVVPYVGARLPAFFKAFAHSCRGALGAVDFLVLLSDPESIPPEARASMRGGESPPWLPPNVKFVGVGANRFARLHARIPSPKAHHFFPGDGPIDEATEPLAAALRDAFARNGRQLVEFKPTIGVVFAEYLKNYSHWAFGDVDVLVGDIGAFLDEDEMHAFDVVSYSFGDNWRGYARGQWTMHRNDRTVNAAYAHCAFLGGSQLEDRLRRAAHYESAEGCYSTALATERLRFKIVTKHFTDATQKGDKDAAWLAEGEVRRCAPDPDAGARRCRPLAPRSASPSRWNPAPWERVDRLPTNAKRCMSWVNPAYQTCLEGGDYGPGDTIVLDHDGRYKRKRGPTDAFLGVPGTGFAAAAFFHLQEWKKKYHSFSVPAPSADAVLGTRYGIVPVPPLVPSTPDAVVTARLRDARAVEYCSFKACGALPAFQRDDLRWAFSASADFPLEEKPGPFDGPPRPEQGVGLVLAVTLTRPDAAFRLGLLALNVCAWPGPAVAVIAVDSEKRWMAFRHRLSEEFARCGRVDEREWAGGGAAFRTTLVLGKVGGGDESEKALANVGLDSNPARFAVVARGAERLSKDAHDAVAAAAAAAAPGATLVLPEFRAAPDVVADVAIPSFAVLEALVQSGKARAAPASRCQGYATALTEDVYTRWFRAGPRGRLGPASFKSLFANASLPLDWRAPAPVLALDSVDARGDRRLVREVEEHRGPGCFDGLLPRALATQHADSFLVVPGVFAVAVEVPRGYNDSAPCGCRAGAAFQPPDKKMRTAVADYDAYLERAVAARGDADDEARQRRVEAGAGRPRPGAPEIV